MALDAQTITDIARVAGTIGTELARVASAAMEGGDIRALERLSRVLADPEALKALDEALVIAQRAKAQAALSGNEPSER